MAQLKLVDQKSFVWMNWFVVAWLRLRSLAKLSPTRMRSTPGQKSTIKHWFPEITYDSARRLSKPGSLNRVQVLIRTPRSANSPLNLRLGWVWPGPAPGRGQQELARHYL